MATKPTKTYDAVAEVRKVRDQLGEAMADMTAEEQKAYLQKKLEEARAARRQRSPKR
jgi:hypothetical protein